MNLIKKILTEVSDGLTRWALLRALFAPYNSQVVAPVALAIKAGTSPLAKHGGSGAALVLVNGTLVKIAAATDMPALTGVSIANGSKGIVGFVVDGAGNLSLAWDGNTATAVGSLRFPAIPDNTVALGYLLIENGTGSTFTGNTTALDAASLTVTYVNQVDGIQPLSTL